MTKAEAHVRNFMNRIRFVELSHEARVDFAETVFTRCTANELAIARRAYGVKDNWLLADAIVTVIEQEKADDRAG